MSENQENPLILESGAENEETVDFSYLMSQETEEKHNRETLEDETEDDSWREVVDENYQEEDEGFENHEPHEPLDPKDAAEMVVMALDLASTLGLGYQAKKRELKRLFNESPDAKKFIKKASVKYKSGGEPDGEIEEKIFQALEEIDRKQEAIPFSEGEKNKLTGPLAKVLSKYNLKMSPEGQLIVALVVIFWGRVSTVYFED